MNINVNKVAKVLATCLSNAQKTPIITHLILTLILENWQHWHQKHKWRQ